MTTHTVTATSLNLRNRPLVAPSTLIAVLDQGTPLTKLGDAPLTGWWKVSVSLQGQDVEGFVAARYLASIGSGPGNSGGSSPLPGGKIPAAHLSEGNPKIKRSIDGGRAHPLGEPGMPGRTSTTASGKAKELVTIVEYLDSSKSSHLRYKKKGGTTFCNIYAFDYCYVAGVYIPRVFWTSNALTDLQKGKSVKPLYGKTVNEHNANMLHDWFKDLGGDFGWQRETDIDKLQTAANQGEVCIIVAQRKDRNLPGHIVAVVPENGPHSAERSGGRVTRPLQSQAGAVNFCFDTGSRRWWLDRKFISFGLWRHA